MPTPNVFPHNIPFALPSNVFPDNFLFGRAVALAKAERKKVDPEPSWPIIKNTCT